MDGTNSAVVVQSVFSVTRLPKVLQDLFLTQVAEIASCVRREREFNGPTLVQTFVFGFLSQPDADSTDLAQTASQCNVQVTASAIDQWLDKPQTATFFKDFIGKVAEYVVLAEAADVELLKRFSGVHLLDSTTVALPDELAHVWSGCGTDSPQGGKAVLKIQTRYDVLRGALLVDLVPGRECDQKAEIKTKDLQPNEMHIRDLGYFDLDALADIEQSKGYFVSRLMHGTIVYDLEGKRLDLLDLLRNADGDIDRWVLVGRSKKLKMRLMARRLPDFVAESRRRKCRQKVKDKGRTATAEQLEMRSWTIMVTNAPVAALPATEVLSTASAAEQPATPWLSIDEAIALMRQRWQIELLFKLWKSQGKLASTRRRKAQRILCEVYAKLLALIVQHWVILYAAWQYADRSMTQASKAVHKLALALLHRLNDLLKLKEELDRIAQMAGKTSKIHRRKKKPAAFQVMDDPTLFGYDRCA
jgi:hypothetical protein